MSFDFCNIYDVVGRVDELFYNYATSTMLKIN